MSILLIGCGYWGQNWAKTLSKMSELSAICEPSTALRVRLAETFPQIAIYADLNEALQHPGIEAVVIATPVPTHREVARQCLLSGKSVLVEKPLTLDPDEAHELVKLADGCGLILAVGHLLLYQPALIALKALMDAGELGDILSVQCTRVNLGKVRNEENIWWSFAPHDLSILSLLLGEPLRLKSASKLNILQRARLEDTVYASFSTPSGRQASVHVSWMSPIKRHETVVIGSKRMAIFEDTLPAEQKLQLIEYDLDRTGDQIQGVAKGRSRYIEYHQPADDLLTLQAKGFLAAVRGEIADIPNNGENGLQVVQMLSDVQYHLDALPSGSAVGLPV